MPLTGTKVIEACSNLAGPVTGTIFGDLGADVIKVEKPNGGDDARGWAPPYWNGQGASFQAINRNKRSVALDLKRPEHVAALKRLVAEADVFVHNMRAGRRRRARPQRRGGTGAQSAPIYCAIGAYGSKGPWRGWSAYDGLAQALSSQMSSNGEPDGGPLLVPGGIVDKGAGMWAAIATLGALLRRASTGRGAVVETSLLETSLFWRDGGFANYQATGRVTPRAGNAAATIVPYGVFPTGTGPMMIGCAGDALFAGLARLLGRPEWIEDPRFASNPARIANRDVLIPLIEAVLATRPRDEWVDLLGATASPARRSSTPPRPWRIRKSRRSASSSRHRARTCHSFPPPGPSTASAPRSAAPAPTLGEDNDAVLG